MKTDGIVAVRTVFVIGTSHEYQVIRRAVSDPAREQFRMFLTSVAIEKAAQAIAEEMSVDALTVHGADESVGKQVAVALQIAHRYCDPAIEERKALGVVEDDDIRMSGFFNNRNPQEVEAAINASFAIREGRWLDHLLELNGWPVLFVCGANHAERFRERLEDNGITAYVLLTKWGPD